MRGRGRDVGRKGRGVEVRGNEWYGDEGKGREGKEGLIMGFDDE